MALPARSSTGWNVLAGVAVVLLSACAVSAAHAAAAVHAAGTALPVRISFAGIGPLHFGMHPQALRRLWSGHLYGQPPEHDPQACYYLAPRARGGSVLLMVEGNRFVRVDVRAAAEVAPGGGRVGMPMRRIEMLYAGRVAVAPAKYAAQGRVLTVTPALGSHVRLVFDVDAVGEVSGWRIGMLPQIDYVEGCG